MYKYLLAIAVFFTVMPLPVLADYTVTSSSAALGTLKVVGYSAGVQEKEAAQWPTIGAGTVSSVTLSLERVGSPSDNLVVDLFADGSGPTGSSLGTSGVLTGSSVATGACADYTFTFATPLSVAAATTYDWVVTRTGPLDTSNFWYICGNSQVSGFVGYEYDGLWVDSLYTYRSVNTVVEGGGGGGGGGATTTAATATDNPTLDAFLGIALFLTGFYGMIWIFKGRH